MWWQHHWHSHAPTNVQTWGWYNGETWPDGPLGSIDLAEALRGQGLTVDAGASKAEITWHDADRDGEIEETNRNWFQWGDTTDGDRVIVNGEEKTLDEVYSYRDSTVMVDGVATKLPVHVFLFTDKTYMLRLQDADIPEGADFSSFGKIELGHYDWQLLRYDAPIHRFDDEMMCFTAGTMIDTPDGPRAVETLMPGDMVTTMDNGPQVIRWAGQRTVSGRGKMAPISFAAGAIGNEVPLQLSPQHRVLIRGWKAELMSGQAEVLSAAKHLVNDDTIRQTACDAVTYVHIMFDSHQIVRSNGAWTESFHPGEQGAEVLSEQWEEITAIFPELAQDVAAYGPTARTCLKAWEARALMA